MNKHHPDMRFDAMRGVCYPYRMTQRVTLAELERHADLLGMRINWDSMRLIGLSTAEVTLTK